MFERFTDRARRVIVLAQEEARVLHHSSIGTEHLLLGLLHEGEGVAAQALVSLDVSLEDLRIRIESAVGTGSNSPSGHIPFTPRAKKVLELSLREALQLGHNHIGTEHLLLGLVREGKGVAAEVLTESGVDLAPLRGKVVEILAAEGLEVIGTAEAPSVPEAESRELLIESLLGEVQRLRTDIDRLREALRRSEPLGEAPPRPAPRLAEGETYQTLLHCSFCDQTQDQVTKLILGPGVYICDQCIALCQEILAEQIPPPEQP